MPFSSSVTSGWLLGALPADPPEPFEITVVPCHVQPPSVQAAIRRHFARRGETDRRSQWRFDCRPEWQRSIVCGWLMAGERPAVFWTELAGGRVRRSRIAAEESEAREIDSACQVAGYSRIAQAPAGQSRR